MLHVRYAIASLENSIIKPEELMKFLTGSETILLLVFQQKSKFRSIIGVQKAADVFLQFLPAHLV